MTVTPVGREIVASTQPQQAIPEIYAISEPWCATGRLRIGLLDCSLAGRLTEHDRVKTAQLIQAVLKKDLRITGLIHSLSAAAKASTISFSSSSTSVRYSLTLVSASDAVDCCQNCSARMQSP